MKSKRTTPSMNSEARKAVESGLYAAHRLQHVGHANRASTIPSGRGEQSRKACRKSERNTWM